MTDPANDAMQRSMTTTRWATRWRAVAIVSTVVAGGALLESLVVSTHHLNAPGWEPHAKFHALIGGLYLAVTSATALLLAWGPLRNGDLWVRVVYSFVMVAMSAVPLVASFAIPGGGPPAFDTALSWVGAAVALGCAWGVLGSPPQARV